MYHPQSNGVMEKANALIFTTIKNIRRPAEGQVGRRIAESSMESQHFHLQSDEIHLFQVTVWRGTGNPRGNQDPQCQDKGGGHT
jgi:hypothetical protein